MKKTALILLLGLYAISSFGIGIKQFYCCGKLTTTLVAFVHSSEDKCSNQDAMKGCCKTEYKTFKVDDNYLSATSPDSFLKLFSSLILFTYSFDLNPLPAHSLAVANASHAPPLHQGTPIFILNCDFRI